MVVRCQLSFLLSNWFEGLLLTFWWFYSFASGFTFFFFASFLLLLWLLNLEIMGSMRRNIHVFCMGNSLLSSPGIKLKKHWKQIFVGSEKLSQHFTVCRILVCTPLSISWLMGHPNVLSRNSLVEMCEYRDSSQRKEKMSRRSKQ